MVTLKLKIVKNKKKKKFCDDLRIESTWKAYGLLV